MKQEDYDIWGAIFNVIKEKPSEILRLEETNDKFMEWALPKTTKVFGTAFLKEIYSIKEDRLLILIGHLYLESFLLEIIKKKFQKPESLEKAGLINSFYKKVRILESRNLLDNETVNDLILINNIRNKFVHNLDYHLNKVDIFGFSFVDELRDEIKIKDKKIQRIFNRMVLKNAFLYLLGDLTKKYPFIHLMDKGPKKSPNSPSAEFSEKDIINMKKFQRQEKL